MKVMIFLLVAAFAGLFFINGPDGSPLLTLDDFKPDVPEIDTGSQTTEVYKWQDENGVWQYSNQPRDAELGETIELDGNINTMPAVDTSILSRSADAATKSTGKKVNIPSGLTSLSGDQAEEMMNSVNNMQQTVDDRKAQMDKLTGQN